MPAQYYTQSSVKMEVHSVAKHDAPYIQQTTGKSTAQASGKSPVYSTTNYVVHSAQDCSVLSAAVLTDAPSATRTDAQLDVLYTVSSSTMHTTAQTVVLSPAI